MARAVSCTRLLRDDGLRYNPNETLIYRELAQPHSQRKIPMTQMMRDEALAAFRAWENKPNKIAY